ncbi:Hypothetical predicted protein [Podarcis lilfordi]|uniref:Uncharacterized protein n=1 Tax=Podarcis lilfordi TaxID=74358 RepID=A0AA35JZN4_9SAUR|nr:Hypothetical predicted protein [Podarcis lilfordi]
MVCFLHLTFSCLHFLRQSRWEGETRDCGKPALQFLEMGSIYGTLNYELLICSCRAPSS